MDPDKSSIQLRSSPDFESEEFKQQVESHKLSLCGRKLTWAIAFVTGTGFTLFGCASMIYGVPRYSFGYRYDQGVMSALLTSNQESQVYQLVRLT